MDPASLALAIIGTVDLCIKYGKKLKSFFQEQRNLQTDIYDVTLILEGVWLKTEVQLQLLEKILRSDLLEPALMDHYLKAIQRLEAKMSDLVVRLETVLKRMLSSSSSKFSFDAKVVFLKRELQSLATDIEEWQRRFDPSWYLITLVSRPTVDKQIQNLQTASESPVRRLSQLRQAVHIASNNGSVLAESPVFRSLDTVQSKRQKIPNTDICISWYRADSQQIILDRTNYLSDATAKASRVQVRDLAWLMRNVEPLTFGLLKCEGILEVEFEKRPQYEFIFEVPSGLHSMGTLRSLFLEKPQFSLSTRIQLAKQLARSVMFVHTVGFVHKGIRPESILIFKQDTGSVHFPFLAGFERIRRADGQTDFLGDLSWERNLYRHPVRQGLWSDEAFIMQHDIYSLGVCLLEIALWRSFVDIHDTSRKPWVDMHIEEAIADKDLRRGGFAIKRRLISMAKERLPFLVGSIYTDLVIACLCCLDGGEENIFNAGGHAVKDADGIIIGVRFIENVLFRMEELLV